MARHPRSPIRPSRQVAGLTLIGVLIAALGAGCMSSVGGTAAVDTAALTPGTATSSSTSATGITQPSRTSTSETESSSSATTSTAASTTAPAAPVPAGLERFYEQQPSWESCAEYSQNADYAELYDKPDLECARILVPLSYEDQAAAADPNGPTIELAIVRKAATDQANRIGSVLFNPGGPGASGIETVASFVEAGQGTVLNERFDLVGFDPRGVGASSPNVTCETNAERDASRAVTPRSRTQQEVDAANAALEQIARLCLERTGQDVGVDGEAFLANIGTRDVARDLDVLRGLLGDAQLTYVGFSYGTSIGVEYAEQFPDNVRALVLDGVANPEEDPITSSLRQGEGFQGAFDDFAVWCAGQPGCVLGTDPAQAGAVYQSLLQPLLDTPLPLTDGRVLSFADARTGTIQALYSDQLREILASALLELSKGNGDILMALADFYSGRDQSGEYGTILEVFNAVRCVDAPAITDPATVTQYNADYDKVAPVFATGDPPGAIQDICAYWPVPPTGEPHTPNIPGLAKLLVISTEGDPATPYQAGVDLAEVLDASLLTVAGTRHTAYLGAGLTCVDEIVDDYLINLELPADGARC